MENWTIVEVLRHARHDWMNRLQLIKGNIALNKMDNVERIMDEMIMEAQQESRLSNLKLPEFAGILLTYNWEKHPFQIEYEILDESGSLPVDDHKLSNWIRLLFTKLETIVEPFQENNLFISIERYNEKNARFIFEFSGTINKNELHSFQNWMVEQTNEIQQIQVKDLSLSQFVVEVMI